MGFPRCYRDGGGLWHPARCKNLYVSTTNHGYHAETHLAAVPAERIGQIHLAGHSNKGVYLLDTHDGPVIDPVWDLYRDAVRRVGPISWRAAGFTTYQASMDVPEQAALRSTQAGEPFAAICAA